LHIIESIMKEHRNSPRRWWICAALAAITIAVFSPVFHYGFINFDDQLYVTENPYVRSGLNFNSLAWAFQTSTSGNWLPLTWISHMLDFQCHGMKAGGHHLTSVLFHAANAALLFLLLQKMTGAVWRSALVAALFAWHPAHVESVAWIAERKDVLSSFFWLLTLWAYVRYTENLKSQISNFKFYYIAALLLFALGLMAKPMIVTLPFVLLLLDFWPLGRMSRPSLSRLVIEKAPLFALSAACCAWTLWAQRLGHAVASVEEIDLAHRLNHVLASYLDYIVMLVFPRRLAIYYPYPLHEQTAMVISGAAVLALLSVLTVASARRRPWLAVGWLWFVGMLVPVIGLVQAGNQGLADRYTYLPAIGLFIILAWGGAELTLRYPVIKLFAPVLAMAALAATWTQVHYWKDSRTVFEHARQVTQNNDLALTLLGELRADDGDLDGAVALYREALRDKPNYAAHFYLARSLEQQGKIDEAKSEYALALRFHPWSEQAHIYLGLLLAGEKKYDQAAAEYEAVLKTNPRSATAHNDLARLLQTEGRLDESVRHYLAALQFDSSLAQAHNNLGVLYLQKGQLADGMTQLRVASRLNPGNVETECNLALALNQQQQWKEASEILRRVAPAQPNNASAQYQYGLALAHQGKTREAMSQYAKALLLTPDFAEPLNELAWIAATDPRPELRNGPQAVGMARRACDLTGGQDPAMLLTLAAAYAEAGRFSEALAAAEKSRDIAKAKGNKMLEEKAALMRVAFEKRQPFRDSAPG
jgi:tetratricopeptide (TPR) repeat protein